MRISDLSRKSKVPVPTIKFYLRDGLLPPGRATARNQAEYGDTHLRRLMLIRLFIEFGRLDLAGVRRLLAGIDDGELSPRQLYRVVHLAQAQGRAEGEPEPDSDVDGFLESLGWHVPARCPGRQTLTSVVEALARLSGQRDVAILAPYAEVAQQLASRDAKKVSESDAATAVATTVLLEVALVVLRRMALEHLLDISGCAPAASGHAAHRLRSIEGDHS